MRHLNDGTLMAYRDRQLPPEEQQAVEAHVATCQVCQERLRLLEADAGRVSRLLSALNPGPFERADARRALADLQTTLMEDKERRQLIPMFDKIRSDKRLQRALTGIAALVVLAGLFSLAPVRALASEFLSLFRVERFAVVEVSPERLEEIDEAIDENMYFGEQEILEEGDVYQVDSLDEAADAVGFKLRVPKGYGDPSEITVSELQKARFTPDLEAMREVFGVLGLDPALLPEEIDGQPFEITLPAGVALAYNDYGEEEDDSGSFVVAQMPSPEAEVPGDIDPQQLGEAMLQLIGMSPEEAARLSEKIDWTTTLVLPIPTDLATVQEINVDGTTGLLFEEHGDTDDDGMYHRSRVLLWQKGGKVYVITGEDIGTSDLLDIADSLK
jgi:anti-sigma factor RsiW